MRRWGALVMVAACASSPKPQSVVTVRETQHVVMNISAWPCSNECHDLDCVLRCPTAQLRPGSCTADENRSELHCRNFVHFHTYDREGRCADGEAPGVERVECRDKAATNDDSGAAKSIYVTLLVLPLLFIYIVASAGSST